MDDLTIFITGYAKLPNGITASQLYSVIVVGVIANHDTGEVIDVDCSLVTSVARRFVEQIVVGKNLNNYSDIAKDISARYHGSARKALLSAFKIICEKYKNLLENESANGN